MDNTQLNGQQPSGGQQPSPDTQNIQWDSQPSQSSQPLANDSNIVWDKPAPHNDEIQQDPNDQSLASKAAHMGVGALEGVGEGLYGTLAGGADIVNKVTGHQPGAITQALHHLAGDDNTEHGGPQQVGRGLETIGEFLMGDAALKGLTMSDKLGLVSKTLKNLEKFPKLQRALALGINIGKAGTQLSPEETALLKQYPVLARLVGVGIDALHAGVTQGVQTTVKSGGDVNKGVTEGAGMAAGSALLGAPLGVAGGLISKCGEAAKTAESLRNAAEAAPTAEDVTGQLENTVKGAINPKIDEAELAKSEAQSHIDNAQNTLSDTAKHAPESAQIAATAMEHAKVAHSNLGDAFEKGRDFLVKAAGDNKIDYEGSGLKNAAKTQLGIGKSLEKPLDEAFEKGQPGSDQAKERLQKLMDPQGEQELKDTVKKGTKAGADGVPVMNDSAVEAQKELDKIEAKGPIQLDMQELLDRRKQANEFLRDTGWQTDEQRADRKIYRGIIDGIDNSVEALLTKSGKPEAMDKLAQMNAEYKAGIKRFDNPVVKSILEGKTGDVLGTLTKGSNPVGNINTLRDTIGKDSFTQLADSSVQRLAADSIDNTTGQLNFNKFFKNWTNIDPEVRQAMFQESAKGGAVENAIRQIQNVNASNVIPNSDVTIKDAGKMIDDLLRKGDITSLIKDPNRLQALNTLVGPEAMSQLGKSVMQNQLREASTTLDKSGAIKYGSVNVDKVLNFLESLKDSPETVKALFKPTPESEAAYNKLVGELKDVQGVKNAVKYGVIAPGGIVAGAGIGHVLGGHAVIGALTLAGSELKFKAGRDILEHIANNPRTWRIIAALNNAGKSAPVQGARIVAPYATGKAGSYLLNALKGTQSTLSK